MKKSQSIFLLSGLVPLMASPIAIVASCSNDTTATTTSFTVKGREITLNNLTDQEKELNQYVSDTAKLRQLIVDKKYEIFNNLPPGGLSPDQIQIVGPVTKDTTAGSLSFIFKVNFFASPNGPAILAETEIILKGFSRISPSL